VVLSKPSIFGCHDTDGDGRLDRRTVLYTEFGGVDAHGMNNGFTRWLDGWIYACHGFRNTSHVQGSDGHKITMQSGNGYRFRSDGSRIEYVWHGQVNPYGIAFDSLGNLFTADCHSKPAYCPNAAEKTVSLADFSHLLQYLLEATRGIDRAAD
jgi:hypothetical protein